MKHKLDDIQQTLFIFAELSKREGYTWSVTNQITNKNNKTSNIKIMKNLIKDCVQGQCSIFSSKEAYISGLLGVIKFSRKSSNYYIEVYYNTADDKKKMESMHKEVKFFKNIGFFENG